MNKDSVTSRMILDFFAGSGAIKHDSASAVERLIIKIIEELLARVNSIGSLEDGRLIASVLLEKHQIAVPTEKTSEYFKQWVEETRKK